MIRYSHDSIVINNRKTALSEIISESAVSFSAFEASTFSFIREWFNHVEYFTLHTSGSTGTPKEIVLTREQLKQSANRTINALALSDQDTALVCLDTKYIAGKMMLVRALEANMKIIAIEPSSNPLQAISGTTQLDFVALVPLQLEAILSDDTTAKQLHEIKSIIIGGASVSENLKSKIQNLTCEVYATYGMTETVSHIALQKLNGLDHADHFTTFPEIKIKCDQRDCLVIELPEFKEQVITNDLVAILDDHSFRLLGRYDNIINSGGIKISPEKIEKAIERTLSGLEQHPLFFVAGLPDERLGQRVVLIVEGNLSISLDPLKPQLSRYEIPKEIYTLPKFIFTETGKINRKKTLELLSNE